MNGAPRVDRVCMDLLQRRNEAHRDMDHPGDAQDEALPAANPGIMGVRVARTLTKGMDHIGNIVATQQALRSMAAVNY